MRINKRSKWNNERLAKLKQIILFRYYSKRSRNETLTVRFSKIYQKNLWGDEESRSGPGSTLQYTKNLREKLPLLCREYDIQSVLDLPCGDLNWMIDVLEELKVSYIGADIVPEIIDNHSRVHATEDRRFMLLDATKTKLPNVDLLLTRDLLLHLNDSQIVEYFRNVAGSCIKYLLVSSHKHSESWDNQDLGDQDSRLVCLTASPWNLPEPRLRIDDFVEGFPPREMLFYEVSQLKSSFENAG